MKYIFFIIIIMSFISLPLYKNKNNYLISLLAIILSLMIIYPRISLNAAKEGINLWLFVVIPSLMPFFIINDMLLSLRVPDNIAKLFSPLAKVFFNTSGYGAYVFIMSIFSGYPAGARITAQLIEDKKINSREGLKILTFSSTSGPLFIIGAVGSGMLNSTLGGYILFISHVAGAILNGIILRFFFPTYKNIKPVQINRTPNTSPLGELLSRAIANSLVTCGYIGGYIILFSVIIALFNQMEFFNTIENFLTNVMMLPEGISGIAASLTETSFEISNGCMIISKLSSSFDIKLILSSFIIAFSGLSIIGQVASVINKTDISIKSYILSKISHGFFSSAICYLILKSNIISVNSISKLVYIIPINPIVMIELLLVILFIFNIISLSTAVIRKKK